MPETKEEYAEAIITLLVNLGAYQRESELMKKLRDNLPNSPVTVLHCLWAVLMTIPQVHPVKD